MERPMLAHKMPSSRFFQRPSPTFRSAVIDLRIFTLLVPGRLTPFSLKLTTFELSSCVLAHHQPCHATHFPQSTGINHLTHHNPSHDPPLQRLGTTIAHPRQRIFARLAPPRVQRPRTVAQICPLFPCQHTIMSSQASPSMLVLGPAPMPIVEIPRRTVIYSARRCVIASSTMDNAPASRLSSASAPSSTA